MTVLTWEKMSPAQARALGRLGKLRNTPKKFILAFTDDDGMIIVVPASGKDPRCWHISKGGTIKRVPR